MFLLLAFLASVTLAPDLRVTELQPGVYVARHDFPWQSNSLVLKMETGEVLLVDTPATAQATERLVSWVEKIFHPEAITAVVTHYHIDRLGGISVLKQHGIPVHGSTQTAKLLKEKGEEMRKLTISWVTDEAIKKAYSEVELLPPTELFDAADPPELEFGTDRVQIIYPGPGHSPDNLVVYDKRRRILFGGCFLIAGEKLGNMTEADPATWLASLAKIENLPAAYVIASHADGLPAYSPRIVANTRKLLEAALAK